MSNKDAKSNVKQLPVTEQPRMQLDLAALEAAKQSLDQGAITPSYGPWREDIIKLLIAANCACDALL